MEGLEFRGLKLNVARVLDEMVKTLLRIVIFGPGVWGVVRTAVTENETAILCVSNLNVFECSSGTATLHKPPFLLPNQTNPLHFSDTSH